MTAPQPAPLSTTLDTALWIVSEWPGARVFPTRGKMPAHDVIKSWKAEATTDVRQVTEWWTDTDYGIGVTGILTIDSDVLDSGHIAREKWGPYLDDAIVWSGNPWRRSFAFQQTDPPTGDGVWEGGEIKGSGYVVVPPSWHDGGGKCADCEEGEHPYRWERVNGHQYPLEPWTGPELARPASPNEAGAVEVPEQWRTSGKPCRAIARVIDNLTWHKDTRHETMREAQLRVLRLGEQGHWGAAAGLDSVHEQFVTALGTDRDRLRGAATEWDRSLRGAAGRIVADGFTDVLDMGCCAPLKVAPADLEDAVFGSTKVLADVRQAARAGFVSPWAMLGSVLALVSAHTPHGYVTPVLGGPGSLNLFVGLVGPSGSGKSQAWEVAQRHLNVHTPLTPDPNMPVASVVGNPTGEGLLGAFMARNPDDDERKAHPYVMREQPNVLVHVDEIEQLSASSGRAGSTIEPILRSMWSGGSVGSQTADAERRRNLPAGSYRVAAVVGIQPGRAGHLLSKDAQSTGTAQRWLWLPAVDSDREFGQRWDEVPRRDWTCPLIRFDFGGGSLRIIPFPEEVWEGVQHERELRVIGRAVGIDSHATLLRARVAALLALLHGNIVVDDAMWEIAGHVMAISDATRHATLATIADEAHEKDRASGRAQAHSEEGYIEARTMTAARKCAALAANDAPCRHEHGAGCTTRCFRSRMRVYREVIDGALDVAVREGWLTRNGDRYYPVVSQ